MAYDLDFLHEYCREIGLEAQVSDERVLDIHLGDGAVLQFVNYDDEEHCLFGFETTPWHAHGNELEFSGPRGYYVELDLLSLLAGLVSGDVLVCDLEADGKLVDRWLVHKNFNNEFAHLDPGERILVRRATCAGKRPVSG